VIFRLQLGFPEMQLDWLKPILGKWITESGKLDAEFYLALVTMHGTIMVFFVLTAGLSGTFSNFLIPLQIGARDMASGFMNMLSYWFFFVSSVVMLFHVLETGPAGRRLDGLSSTECTASGDSRIWCWYDDVVNINDVLYSIDAFRRYQLYNYSH